MKKMYITIIRKNTSHIICANDISKIYYFKSRPVPKLPKYAEDDECEEKDTAD